MNYLNFDETGLDQSFVQGFINGKKQELAQNPRTNYSLRLCLDQEFGEKKKKEKEKVIRSNGCK